MNAKLLSLLGGVALCAGAGMASAAEPVALTAAQMDGVTAGISVLSNAGSVATTGGSSFPLGGTASTTGATTGAALSLCCTPTSSASESVSQITTP
jgi:hypothetical protein